MNSKLASAPQRTCGIEQAPARRRLLQRHFLKRAAELASCRMERRRAVRLAMRFLQVRPTAPCLAQAKYLCTQRTALAFLWWLSFLRITLHYYLVNLPCKANVAPPLLAKCVHQGGRELGVTASGWPVWQHNPDR